MSLGKEVDFTLSFEIGEHIAPEAACSCRLMLQL